VEQSTAPQNIFWGKNQQAREVTWLYGEEPSKTRLVNTSFKIAVRAGFKTRLVSHYDKFHV
jgi:hypothetical protein